MGFLRLLLAFFVSKQHLQTPDLFLICGSLSVLGYFVLSGFLMTLIINEVYSHGLRGRLLFLLNRFFRIYPVYWVCLLIAVIFLRLAPVEGIKIFPDMRLPEREWWQQITIFGLQPLHGLLYSPRVIQPAWSLNTELIYYLVIGLLIGKSKKLCMAWFMGSVIYVGSIIMDGHSSDSIYYFNFRMLYFNIIGSSLQFSAGAMAYHYCRHLPVWRSGGQVFLLILTLVLIMLPDIVHALALQWRLYHYFMTAAFIYIIPAFYKCEKAAPLHAPAPRMEPYLKTVRKINYWCSHISYPYFLIHCSAGAVVSHYWLQGQPPSASLFYHTAIFSLFLSIFIVLAVEFPIESLRKIIRKRALA